MQYRKFYLLNQNNPVNDVDCRPPFIERL